MKLSQFMCKSSPGMESLWARNATRTALPLNVVKNAAFSTRSMLMYPSQSVGDPNGSWH